MQWIYLIHEFHNLSWITEINELFHDILIYWDAPVLLADANCLANKLAGAKFRIFLDIKSKYFYSAT